MLVLEPLGHSQPHTHTHTYTHTYRRPHTHFPFTGKYAERQIVGTVDMHTQASLSWSQHYDQQNNSVRLQRESIHLCLNITSLIASYPSDDTVLFMFFFPACSCRLRYPVPWPILGRAVMCFPAKGCRVLWSQWSRWSCWHALNCWHCLYCLGFPRCGCPCWKVRPGEYGNRFLWCGFRERCRAWRNRLSGCRWPCWSGQWKRTSSAAGAWSFHPLLWKHESA